ncbi:hypothetical protein [Streptomyces pactum]|uniref:hypothetical protein n=1 Tax=Streptomyces pactum TaxID=68249 RepID=UPI001E5DB635|nr:hypothetical protein [Streptomyces pactum]
MITVTPPLRTRRPLALRAAALLAVPLLALTAACSDGSGAGIAVADDDASATDDSRGGGRSGEEGGSGDATDGRSAFYDAQLTYARCMRKEGLKDWPDPKLSGYADWTKIGDIQQAEEERDGQQRLQKAMTACKEPLQRAMQLEPPRDQQKVYESLLAHARCMRANGVSKFTNPVMEDGNAIPGGDPSPADPQLDVRSPAYQRAETACADQLIDAAEGMQ